MPDHKVLVSKPVLFPFDPTPARHVRVLLGIIMWALRALRESAAVNYAVENGCQDGKLCDRQRNNIVMRTRDTRVSLTPFYTII